MSQYKTNICAFVAAAASSSDPVVKAYCGMVAIELVLKQDTGLKDHNVPAALIKFAHKFAIGNQKGCKVRLVALSTQLSNALKTICVQGTDGAARFMPSESYPNIRYTRWEMDGWSAPATASQQLTDLADIVSGIQHYLATKFEKSL